MNAKNTSETSAAEMSSLFYSITYEHIKRMLKWSHSHQNLNEKKTKVEKSVWDWSNVEMKRGSEYLRWEFKLRAAVPVFTVVLQQMSC